MENSTFDKIFADKMRLAGAPDLSEEDWGRLSPLLEAEQKRRWRVVPLWWLGALTGLLLCSNIGWWWMWKQSDQKAQSVRAEWKQIKQQENTKRDTIWSKMVVHQYDTIYRTTVIYRTATDAALSQRLATSDQQNKAAFAFDNDNQAISTNTELSDAGIQAPGPKFPMAGSPLEPSTQTLETVKKTTQLDVIPTDLEPFKIPVRNVEIPQNDLVTIPLKHQARSSSLPILIPRKFRIGAGAGIFIPSAPNFTQNAGFTTVLTGELAFSDQMALVLEGAYAGVSFKGTEDTKGLGLPTDISPGDDFKLKYFQPEEGLISLWHLKLGMQYWINARHRLSPYLGLGYTMQWQGSYELKFEYTNLLTGNEKELSRELGFRINPTSYFDAQAGLRYRISRRFSLQSGAFYQGKIDQNQSGIPGFWGLKSSVIYAF